MLSLGNIKRGFVLDIDGEPYVVKSAQHVKMGRGGAVVKTKIKSLSSGKMLERNFKSGDAIKEASITRKKSQFLYRNRDNFYFMDQESFEQFSLTALELDQQTFYLQENQEYDIIFYQDRPIHLELPTKITFEVTETDAGVRGDTAQGSVTKEATIETEQRVKVPLFIKQGDKIVINTETGEYVERA